MNWVFQKQFVVTVIGGRDFKYEIFPENKEKEARSCYANFLVRYPDAEVEFRKEEREVSCRMGRFRISDDGGYAVNIGDDEFYYTLPKRTMTDNQIRKFLNNIYNNETGKQIL